MFFIDIGRPITTADAPTATNVDAPVAFCRCEHRAGANDVGLMKNLIRVRLTQVAGDMEHRIAALHALGNRRLVLQVTATYNCTLFLDYRRCSFAASQRYDTNILRHKSTY
ncbi:MAG: hypothetical protein JWQ90_5282 [Hydrocarboniphaga sp.]|nr:hypothetical protein [Hydrocarboniphaga sp.]MDB5972832.1 hypothetical protein [Hydrocarboniphaga sp.]